MVGKRQLKTAGERQLKMVGLRWHGKGQGVGSGQLETAGSRWWAQDGRGRGEGN